MMPSTDSILQNGLEIDPRVWGFMPDTINHEMMPKFGRGLESYERQLMINRSELKDKMILDLGAGPELKFATDLKAAGISAHVISMSPDFGIDKHVIRAIDSAPSEEKNILAAIGQAIPLPKETFDIVLLLHVEEHLPLLEIVKMFQEISRVLRKGGFAKMGPITNTPHEKPYLEKLTSYDNLMETLRRNNVQITTEAIPEDVIPKRYIHDSDGGDKSLEPSFNIVLRKSV